MIFFSSASIAFLRSPVRFMIFNLFNLFDGNGVDPRCVLYVLYNSLILSIYLLVEF